MSVISSQYIQRITLLRDKVESFARYPFSLPAIRSFDSLDLHPKVTFFVGENGSGKGIAQVAYEDTEHFKITRDFLAHHQHVMRALMAP